MENSSESINFDSPSPSPSVNSSSSLSTVRRSWTSAEDRRVSELVGELGAGRWSEIEKLIDGRTAKQIRERW